VAALLCTVATAFTYHWYTLSGRTKEDVLISTRKSMDNLRKARDILRKISHADDIIEKGIPTLKFQSLGNMNRIGNRNVQRTKSRLSQLDYSDPYHNEPYDQVRGNLNIPICLTMLCAQSNTLCAEYGATRMGSSSCYGSSKTGSPTHAEGRRKSAR
jgi:hypothetical protein